jgi:5-oxopent-3-ene-1,2,5-tricarboxylate decarboxylase / 2-hydroxyhepta-2,4-diene-1,7-dioate isomerase
VLVGASLGIVVGRVACRVSLAQALRHVAGYIVVGELSLRLQSHYRPAVRHTSRDGYCPLGAQFAPADAVAEPDALAVQVSVGGMPVQRTTTGDRLRGVAQLLADVSAFMTLRPGDVLALGAAHGAPLGRAGQGVVMEIAGVGRLGFTLIASTVPA